MIVVACTATTTTSIAAASIFRRRLVVVVVVLLSPPPIERWHIARIDWFAHLGIDQIVLPTQPLTQILPCVGLHRSLFQVVAKIMRTPNTTIATQPARWSEVGRETERENESVMSRLRPHVYTYVRTTGRDRTAPMRRRNEPWTFYRPQSVGRDTKPPMTITTTKKH
jgi:hypothetical protein